MAFEKITDEMLEGKGNIGKPNTPGVSTQEMQRIMDEIPREVIVPAFNEFLDALQSDTAAQSIGTQIPDGLSSEIPHFLQDVLSAIVEYVNGHKNNKENPHQVTAAQTGAYTKEETNQAINDKIVDLGGGDMQQAVYDPTGQRKDIFAEIAKYMRSSIYDPQDKSQDIFAYPSHVYMATFLVDGWTGDGPYTQTVAVEKYNGGPDITAESVMLPGMGIDDAIQGEAQDNLLEAASIVDKGTKTLGNNTLTCVVQEKPESDAEVYFSAMNGGV